MSKYKKYLEKKMHREWIKVLKYLLCCMENNNEPPRQQDISRYLGVSRNAGVNRVKQLEIAGYVTVLFNTPRGIRVTSEGINYFNNKGIT